MAAEGKGKLSFAKRGKTGILYIPADITRDSTFPLKPGPVLIRIEKDALIIKQAR